MPPFLPPILAAAPPPVHAVIPGDRPEWLRRGRIVLAAARDSLGRAGRPALHRVADDAADFARSLAAKLAAGSTSLYGWWRSTLDGLVARHYAGTLAMTSGATPPLDALDDLDGRVAQQAGFLARLRSQLSAGLDRGDGFLARAASYGKAVWSTGINVLRGILNDEATQERWHLDDGARHCHECPYLASLGWVDAGVLPDVGSTPCGVMCRCWVEVR